MQLRGEWIAADDSRRTGELRAWGEWEPESSLVRCFSPRPPQPDESLHPRFLWRPCYSQKASYRGLHNTDPFIFGECFLYSNCRQAKNPGLRRLARGSVIAFGSAKKVNSEWKWMLDTVFVVMDFVDYAPRNPREIPEDWTPDAFRVATGGPLTDNDHSSAPGTCAPTRTRLRLYRGATPCDPVDGMFGFFPATPSGGAQGDRSFPRPFVDLSPEYFTPALAMGPKGLSRNLKDDAYELRSLWDSLVAQVRDADLVLGTRAELPEQREA